MAQKTNDGGPAFPRTAGSFCAPHEGMSLRDYFAGQALAGLMTQGNISRTSISVGALAAAVYDIADALLELREDGLKKKAAPAAQKVAVVVQPPVVTQPAQPTQLAQPVQESAATT